MQGGVTGETDCVWHTVRTVLVISKPDVMVRGASEGKGPRRRPQDWWDRRLQEVAKAVGGGYCR